MGKEVLTLGNIEIEKQKIYLHKSPILLKTLEIEKMLVSNKVQKNFW